jgi:hypothetical protein
MNYLPLQISLWALLLSKRFHPLLLTTELKFQRNASSLVAQREHGGHQAFVLVTGADSDAISQVATRELRAEQHIARPMVEEEGVNTWVALKAQRGRQKIASPMVVAEDVGFQGDALRLHEASQGFVLDMAGGRGVRLKAAPVVLKDRLGCVFLMGVDAVVYTKHVRRVLRGVPCSAKLMVGEGDAYLQDAAKEPKGVRRCARDMVGESAACLMVVEFVQKVSMEGQTFVLPMVVERGVLCQAVQRVRVAVLIVVSGMVVGSGASLKIVGRVPKVALISARLMAGVNDVPGVRENVRSLPGVRVVYVLRTAAWSKRGRQTRLV